MDKEIVQRAARWYDHWWSMHGAVNIEVVLNPLTPALRQRVRESVLEIATAKSTLFQQRGVEGYDNLPSASFPHLPQDTL